MRPVFDWSPSQILKFFRTGGAINASQFQAMDEDTRSAFETLYLKAEGERIERIMETAMAGVSRAIARDAAAESPAEPYAEQEGESFPLRLGGDK